MQATRFTGKTLLMQLLRVMLPYLLLVCLAVFGHVELARNFLHPAFRAAVER
jgi:hypothetical protein